MCPGPDCSASRRRTVGVISEYENTLTCAPAPGAVTMLLRPVKKSTNPAARLTPDLSFP